MNERGPAWPRRALALVFGLCALVLIGIAATRALQVEGRWGAVLAVILFIALAAISLRSRGPAARRGMDFGLALGLLWVVEIGINNLVQPPMPMRDWIDDGFALAVLAGQLWLAIHAAGTRRALPALAASGWAGLASGAMACLTALILALFGSELLLSDPLNRAEWADVARQNPGIDAATYFTQETMAGALLHLLVLGLGVGMVLGLLATVGAAIYRVARARLR